MESSRWFGFDVLIVLCFDLVEKQTATFQRMDFTKYSCVIYQLKYNEIEVQRSHACVQRLSGYAFKM